MNVIKSILFGNAGIFCCRHNNIGMPVTDTKTGKTIVCCNDCYRKIEYVNPVLVPSQARARG